MFRRNISPSSPGTKSKPISACWLLHADFFLGLLFEPEDRGIMFLRNICILSPDYTMLYPRREYSSVKMFSPLGYSLIMKRCHIIYNCERLAAPRVGNGGNFFDHISAIWDHDVRYLAKTNLSLLKLMSSTLKWKCISANRRYLRVIFYSILVYLYFIILCLVFHKT
jgi:hypothetical protein